MQHKDLNQILCAALINEGFREKLLNDPAATITAGYQGFTFSISQEEQRIVDGIRAASLEDFAAQVYAGMHPKRLGILVDLPARVAAEPLPLIRLQPRICEEALLVH